MKLAMSLVFLIYLAVMCIGYYAYGEFIQPDIVNSLMKFPSNQAEALGTAYSEWTGPRTRLLETILSSMLLMKIVVSLCLQYQVVFYSFQTFKYTRDIVPLGSVGNKLMRVAVVGVSVCIARVVGNFGQLFSLIMSFTGPPLHCIFPLYFSYKIRRDLGVAPTGAWRKGYHCILVCMLLFVLTIGTYESLLDILTS